MSVVEVEEAYRAVRREVGKVVVGQEELIEAVFVALLAEGHVLIEGPPGLGKTLLATTISRVLKCRYSRIQFTPDLMPSDVTGHSVYNLQERRFHFSEGPVFANLLLADEINRAPAKTQASLLEAMQECQVTVDGQTMPLPRPFITLATQNPIEQEGTYPLPEAQLDRFLFKLLVTYPTFAQEAGILNAYNEGRDPRRIHTSDVQSILDDEGILRLQASVRDIVVEPSIIDYIVRIVTATREHPAIEIGASPRSSVGLLVASRALAACLGRTFVVPDDIKQLVPWILRHRIRLEPEAEIEGSTIEVVLGDLLETTEAPKA